MKATNLLTASPLTTTETTRIAARKMAPSAIALQQLSPVGTPPTETIRHILLGSPGAIQQTIHLLHTLRYSETILWSPVTAVEESLIITPAQGEAISLLRKQI